MYLTNDSHSDGRKMDCERDSLQMFLDSQSAPIDIRTRAKQKSPLHSQVKSALVIAVQCVMMTMMVLVYVCIVPNRIVSLLTSHL